MWLTFTAGPHRGRTVKADGVRFTIGRDPACSLVIDDERVSRQHASLTVFPDGRCTLRDLDSANGTLVDGRRIGEPRALKGGELLQFGNTTLVVSAEEPVGGATVVGATPVPPAVPAQPEAPPPAEPPSPTPSAGDAHPAPDDERPASPPEPPPPGPVSGDQPKPGLPPSPPPPPPPPPSGASNAPRMPTPSTIERIKLRRSVNRAFLLAGAAVIAALVVLGLALAGVFSRGSDSLDIPEIVARAKASTVMVISKVNGEPRGSGTGWVYDAGRGLIVTNAHVVNGGQTYSVRLESGERPVDVVGVAVCDDLALLRVADTDGLRTLQLADGQDRVKQGQRVIALGFPASASEAGNLTATEGIVSVVRTRFDLASIDVPRYPNVIQTDAVINPGNSGGPLVDTDGRLVGVNSAGITLLGGRTIQGQGYAVGVDRVKEVIPTLATGVSAGWSGLGFDYIPDPEEVSGDLNDAGLPTEPGLLVTSAVEGSPAAQVGFGRGPVLITAVNGRQMDGSLPAFCEALGDPGTASEATYTVYESGDTAPKDVTVAVAGR